jgi:hypothetical protein
MIITASEFLTAGVIALAWTGLQEAVIRPVANRFTKRRIIKYAPAAMQFLDEQMPRMIIQNDSETMEALLTERLELVTGESWKKSEIDELFSIYDARITADKHLS